MKITINQSEQAQETEIVVYTREMTPQIRRMLSLLRLYDQTVTATREGRIYFVELGEIFYFDTVDDKVFLYTEDNVLETQLRLYEIEARLAGTTFLRISKSCIANLDYVESMLPLLNGKVELALKNGEKLVVSRHHCPDLKRRLGL